MYKRQVLSLLNCILAETAVAAKEISMENLKDLDERLLKLSLIHISEPTRPY